MNIMRHLVFVIYDGIQNSVFQSQVLQPLLKRLEEEPNLHVTLVSFERSSFSYQTMSGVIPALDRFDVIVARRLPFLGRASLLDAARRMRSILLMLSPDMCIARGPLAGYVVLRAFSLLFKAAQKTKKNLNINDVPAVIIQARGLAAEEYRYAQTHKKMGPVNTLLSWGMYSMLRKVEELVYGNNFLYAQVCKVKIEAVSRALKVYLEQQYGADPALVFVAQYDIPQVIDPVQCLQWRSTVRKQLGIGDAITVYCYSGSFKPWQCVEETITHFMHVQKNNSAAYLLILSADKKLFIAALQRRGLSPARYTVLSVLPEELYKYLAVADFGYLLREADIINWVSRPTKLLEYQAVGLPVIHNNTIGLLCGDIQA